MKDTDKLDVEEREDAPRKDNTTKRIVLSSLIIVVAVVIIGLSIAYAYYVNSVQNGGGNNSTTISSGALEMSIVTNQYINVNSATLINDTDVINSGAYTQFSILIDDNSVEEAKYTINLTILGISTNFSESSYVKWALYQCDNSDCGSFTGAAIANGDFYGKSTGVMPLAENITINDEETHYYRLYIWLSNDPDNNQVGLLEGTLEAQVGFSATT